MHGGYAECKTLHPSLSLAFTSPLTRVSLPAPPPPHPRLPTRPLKKAQLPPATQMDASVPMPQPQPEPDVSFVPCVEDSTHTRRVGRHPALFQRTLDAVALRFLTASARRARAPAAVAPDAAAPSTMEGAAAAILAESYTQLWLQRWQVPQASRREWYETVLVHLEALDALSVSLLWLTDAEDGDSGTQDAAAATTSPTTRSSSTASSSPDGPRKARKRAAQDTHPLWYLWQDPPHHLHYMTLRLRPWTPAAGGAYATRAAMRVADLVHMDSAAFGWRVRQWCSVADLITTSTHYEDFNLGGTGSSISGRAVHAGFGREVAHRLRAAADATVAGPATLGGFAAEEPEVARLLLRTLCPSAVAATERADVLPGLRRRVAGALVYRMLLEVALGRLRALPRCPFTWRLLVDVLSHVRVDPADGAGTAAAVLPLLAEYVTAVVLPYLESRDCHLGGMRHSAPQVHAHFTQRALAHMTRLCTAALGSDAVAGVAQDSGQPGHLPASLRRAVAMQVEACLRCACLDPEGVEAAADAVPAEAQEIMRSALLDDVSDAAGDDDDDAARDGEQAAEDARPLLLPDGVTDAMRRDFRRKVVDERVLHSATARVAQLRLFLFHFFAQCPTHAFDRVAVVTGDGAAAAAAAEAAGGSA